MARLFPAYSYAPPDRTGVKALHFRGSDDQNCEKADNLRSRQIPSADFAAYRITRRLCMSTQNFALESLGHDMCRLDSV